MEMLSEVLLITNDIHSSLPEGTTAALLSLTEWFTSNFDFLFEYKLDRMRIYN